MALRHLFNTHAAYALASARKRRAVKRPPPFSLRLNESERARLIAEAKGVPLGTYVKAKLLGDAPLRLRRSGRAVADRPALAQALALLGRSHMAGNLNQLAYAANIGTLDIGPETERQLQAALRDVRTLRDLLLKALGLKVEAVP